MRGFCSIFFLLISSTCGALAAPKGHSSQQGWTYLRTLEMEKAHAIFQKVLSGPDHYSGISGNFEKAQSALGTARLKAETGDFKQALSWLRRWQKDFPSKCDTCSESRTTRAGALRASWQALLLPKEEGRAKLERIAGGAFKAETSNGYDAKAQKKMAISEANLRLGVLCMSEGKRDEARIYLKKVLSTPLGTAPIAAAYLSRLDRPGT